VKYDPWKTIAKPTRPRRYFLPRIPHRARHPLVMLVITIFSVGTALAIASVLYFVYLYLKGL
jgi:hypothetical protein